MAGSRVYCVVFFSKRVCFYWFTHSFLTLKVINFKSLFIEKQAPTFTLIFSAICGTASGFTTHYFGFRYDNTGTFLKYVDTHHIK